jgi:Spy/CpxP family protein refolding chaperone
MKLRSLLRILPAVALAATLGTAVAKPKAKASPSPSPAAETQDATAASSPAPETSPAAGGKKRTMSPDTLKKRFMTELQHQAGLTTAQEPKVKPIIDKYVNDREGVKNDASLTTAAKKDKLKQLRAQYESDINGVLTPDQQKKWTAYREGRRAKLRVAREKAAANRKVSTGATTQPTPAAKTSQ